MIILMVPSNAQLINVCVFSGKAILISQSSWQLWDLGQIIVSWKAITCRS